MSGIALETAVDGSGELRRNSGCDGRQAGWRVERLSRDECRDVLFFERQPAAYGEVSDYAERINVAASIEGFVGTLLRAHEVRGAHDLAHVSQCALPTAVGNPEIGHHCAPCGSFEQDVVRLDV